MNCVKSDVWVWECRGQAGKRKKIIKLPGVEPVKRRKKKKRNTKGIRVECL